MKREFAIKCTYENRYLVKSIVGNFYRTNMFVKETNDGSSNIRFKCMRSKLAECRMILGRMLNEGVLLAVEEIW